MNSHLVSEYWCGAMNVDKMRTFDNAADAWAYLDSLGGICNVTRIYRTSSDKPPVKLKEKDRPAK